jgi:hypothetical protein
MLRVGCIKIGSSLNVKLCAEIRIACLGIASGSGTAVGGHPDGNLSGVNGQWEDV